MTLLLLVLAVGSLAAEPTPRVKIEVTPKEGAWVGQRVTLAITLYTPDLFAGAPVFEMPPIPSAIVLPPSGSSVVGSEQIGDASYTTQRHEFAVYAQRPGNVRVPAFVVQFETNSGFGKPVVQRKVTTDAVAFAVKTPPGAEGLGTVIAARDLKIVDNWKPDPRSLKVGDAFTRTLKTTADEVPGMVLPSVGSNPIDGLSAYPKPPTVSDHTERGSLKGQRTDTVTFICERPGSVTIPDLALTWFDLDASELKTVKIPGRTFDIAPTANAITADPPPATTVSPPAARSWWTTASLVVAAVGMAWFAIRGVAWWHRVKAARAESELVYFSLLRRACHSGDASAIYVALLAWLDRAGGTSFDDFLAAAQDPLLSQAACELRSRVYSRSGSDGKWEGARGFFERVHLANNTLGKHHTTTECADVLPPLNPVSADVLG